MKAQNPSACWVRSAEILTPSLFVVLDPEPPQQEPEPEPQPQPPEPQQPPEQLPAQFPLFWFAVLAISQSIDYMILYCVDAMEGRRIATRSMRSTYQEPILKGVIGFGR